MAVFEQKCAKCGSELDLFPSGPNWFCRAHAMERGLVPADQKAANPREAARKGRLAAAGVVEKAETSASVAEK